MSIFVSLETMAGESVVFSRGDFAGDGLTGCVAWVGCAGLISGKTSAGATVFCSETTEVSTWSFVFGLRVLFMGGVVFLAMILNE
jgi:hypothetical protein